jgi:hypothetical protein
VHEFSNVSSLTSLSFNLSGRDSISAWNCFIDLSLFNLCLSHTAPDLIVFHSLTNEMVENSVEQLCRQNQRNNSDCFGFIPRYKSCVIHSDSKIRYQKVTHAVSKVRHLPHLPPLRYGHECPDLTDESHPWCFRNDQLVFLYTTNCYYHIYRYFEHQDIHLWTLSNRHT